MNLKTSRFHITGLGGPKNIFLGNFKRNWFLTTSILLYSIQVGNKHSHSLYDVVLYLPRMEFDGKSILNLTAGLQKYCCVQGFKLASLNPIQKWIFKNLFLFLHTHLFTLHMKKIA